MCAFCLYIATSVIGKISFLNELKMQIGIIGGGSSSLLLSQFLHIDGVESMVLGRHSREYVLSRIRAGVLEGGTVQ